MAQTIETVFADLRKKHNLTSINVGFSESQLPEYSWSSYVHWDVAVREQTCATGIGSTAELAITQAVARANKCREIAVDAPSLVIETA